MGDVLLLACLLGWPSSSTAPLLFASFNGKNLCERRQTADKEPTWKSERGSKGVQIVCGDCPRSVRLNANVKDPLFTGRGAAWLLDTIVTDILTFLPLIYQTVGGFGSTPPPG